MFKGGEQVRQGDSRAPLSLNPSFCSAPETSNWRWGGGCLLVHSIHLLSLGFLVNIDTSEAHYRHGGYSWALESCHHSNGWLCLRNGSHLLCPQSVRPPRAICLLLKHNQGALLCSMRLNKENSQGAVVVVYSFCTGICLGALWWHLEGPDAFQMASSPHTASVPSDCPPPSTNDLCHSLGHSPFHLAFSCPPSTCVHGFPLKAKVMEVTHDIHETCSVKRYRKREPRPWNRKSVNSEPDRSVCELCPAVYRLGDLGVITSETVLG